MKRKISFHEPATVHYTPLPTPEEKQACFYSLDEIANFRNQVESEAWQEYLSKMMDQPLTNPFHQCPQGEENDASDDREDNPSSPTRALHRSDTVQDQLFRQVDSSRPVLFGPSKARLTKGACHQVTKQSLTLVAGLCILAYLYTG